MVCSVRLVYARFYLIAEIQAFSVHFGLQALVQILVRSISNSIAPNTRAERMLIHRQLVQSSLCLRLQDVGAEVWWRLCTVEARRYQLLTRTLVASIMIHYPTFIA